MKCQYILENKAPPTTAEPKSKNNEKKRGQEATCSSPQSQSLILILAEPKLLVQFHCVCGVSLINIPSSQLEQKKLLEKFKLYPIETVDKAPIYS